MTEAKPKIYLLSSIRNEGPFLLEFVAHHLVLGFDRIFIASNDCDDGSAGLLSALDAAGYVTHVKNRVKPGEIPQHEGYRKIRAAHDIDSADWLMMLDADEFLNVHVGDHGVDALVAEAPEDVDVIALNAATFGSGGEAEWRPGPVTGMFHYRHETAHPVNAPVKTLSRRPGDYKKIHNHSLVGYRGTKLPLRVMRADGSMFDIDHERPIWRQLRNFPVKRISHGMAQYNHYAVKTWDSYQARRDRGRGAAPKGEENLRHDDAYFTERAMAAERDDTILRYAPALALKMEEMLGDGSIRRWQERTEERYRARVASYR
ncbi:glycosyltransferase family 2 protein [Ostreiculturibacter nitratireducens]|uniref:glycosyltransferase family 2 protein n=1 Tax=Ostreiculturibacter nitratireducens TaxID=3075226 RepID=UPI0031B5A137